MSFPITDAFIQNFSSTVHFLAQQEKSRIRGKVVEEPITGESAYMEQLAPTAARKATARHEDSPIMNSQHLRRRIAPYSYKWGDLIDREDKLRLIIDPESSYAQHASYAMGRAFDDELLAGGFGTAYSGHSGSTALTWPNGNSESSPTAPAGTQVGVSDWTYGNGSGNSGLTVSKIIYGRVALLQAEGDEDEEIYIGVGGKQIGNLLATTEFTSSDYQEVRTLNTRNWNGMTAFGCTFVHTERLLTNSSGQTRVMMWRKSGLGLGVAQDVRTMIAARPDKSFSTYVYADESIGAARLEEPKVVELVCA